MRLLMLHVDYFNCKVTERGRSKVVEKIENLEITVNEALIVLSSVEKADEHAPGFVANKAVVEIINIAQRLKVNTIVIHSFAHLFGELSTPEVAVQVLKMTEEELKKRGFNVFRTPFGWFNTLELKAKGHPLSRIARIVSASD